MSDTQLYFLFLMGVGIIFLGTVPRDIYAAPKWLRGVVFGLGVVHMVPGWLALWGVRIL